jgi:hypothetical protein
VFDDDSKERLYHSEHCRERGGVHLFVKVFKSGFVSELVFHTSIDAVSD